MTPKTTSNHELNPDQHQAATSAPSSPLLIVAGAGTGKTRTLTQRIGFLRSTNPGQKICAITFTNKAAREMEERLGKLESGHFVGTFHSLGARILRKNAKMLGRTAGFVIFDEKDSFALVKKILKEFGASAKLDKKEGPAVIRGKISERKNNPIEKNSDSRVEKDRTPEQDVFEASFTRYEEALREANAFDFDDLLHKVVLLLSQSEEVRDKYQNWFRHVLVDEYQDVNPIQNQLVKVLTSGGASLSVVGDAEQTIYGWRGSDIGIFLRFPEEWESAKMVTLTQNYRSTGNILKAAGGVISKNEYDTKIERAINLWTENQDGAPVMLYEAFDEDSEAEWIADTILPEMEKETAILYRTNAQSRAIEQALLRRRIPYRVYGGLKFYERREIKDVVAALRVAINPQDELSQDRLRKNFSQKVNRAIREAFAELPKNPSPAELIESFLDGAEYIDYMERTMTKPRERIENIEELIRFAGDFKEVPRFLEEITLLQAADDLGKTKNIAAKDQVNLMTIHLAKGLELDRVFVAGCNEGLLPHSRSMETETELQEERRLMYVAMTRARKELFLSFYGIPSRFLGEIPEETLEMENSDSGSGLGGFDISPWDDEERYITLD